MYLLGTLPPTVEIWREEFECLRHQHFMSRHHSCHLGTCTLQVQVPLRCHTCPARALTSPNNDLQCATPPAVTVLFGTGGNTGDRNEAGQVGLARPMS